MMYDGIMYYFLIEPLYLYPVAYPIVVGEHLQFLWYWEELVFIFLSEHEAEPTYLVPEECDIRIRGLGKARANHHYVFRQTFHHPLEESLWYHDIIIYDAYDISLR